MLLLAAAASAASFAPASFVLDRAALEQGEIWRLWTGHLVHHTFAHFAFDVGVAVVLLSLVRRATPWLLLAPCVSAAVLVLRPDLATYAGLSGVLHGVTVLAGFDLLRRGSAAERWMAGGLVGGVAAKAVYEAAHGASLFSGGFDMGAETVFAAHLAGVLGGFLIAGGRFVAGLLERAEARALRAR